MHEAEIALVARLPPMRRPSLPRPSLPKLPKRRKKPLTPQQAASKPRAAAAATPKAAAAAKPKAAAGAAKPKSGPGPRSDRASRLRSLLRPAALKLIVPAVVALVVVILLLGTCGSDDEKQVRHTLNAFAKASRDKDYQALCDDLLSTKLVDALRTADRPCEVVLRIALSEVQNPTLEVLSVKVDGDEATAQADTGAAGQPSFKTKILLKREDGDWRIASLPDERRATATP